MCSDSQLNNFFPIWNFESFEYDSRIRMAFVETSYHIQSDAYFTQLSGLTDGQT